MSKDDLLSQIRSQNTEIDELISAGEEFKVIFTKTGSDGNKLTAVAKVSCKIRDTIKHNRNRIFIGVTACRVYDRFFVKRCNNCQEFGHYHEGCQKPVKCGYCGDSHASKECTLKDDNDYSKRKCCNCKVNHPEHEEGHSAFWVKCPSYIAEQRKQKQRIPYYEGLNR